MKIIHGKYRRSRGNGILSLCNSLFLIGQLLWPHFAQHSNKIINDFTDNNYTVTVSIVHVDTESATTRCQRLRNLPEIENFCKTVIDKKTDISEFSKPKPRSQHLIKNFGWKFRKASFLVLTHSSGPVYVIWRQNFYCFFSFFFSQSNVSPLGYPFLCPLPKVPIETFCRPAWRDSKVGRKSVSHFLFSLGALHCSFKGGGVGLQSSKRGRYIDRVISGAGICFPVWVGVMIQLPQ